MAIETKEARTRSVRILATDEEWQRLKVLAVYAEQELQEFFTAALQTSPLTSKAFTTNGSGATSPEASARAATKGA